MAIEITSRHNKEKFCLVLSYKNLLCTILDSTNTCTLMYSNIDLEHKKKKKRWERVYL